MSRLPLLAAAFLAAAFLFPAAASAATQWLDPVTLSPAGSDVGDLDSDVAMNGRGDTLAVWSRGGVMEASFRPAGGSFGPVEQVPQAPGGTGGVLPVAALDGSVGVILSVQFLGSGIGLARATRNADGSYAETTIISTPGRYASLARLAGNAAGDMVAMWEENDGTNNHLATTFRPHGGEFGPLATFASEGMQGYAGAVDPGGNAIVVWDAGTTIDATSRPAGGGFGDATPVVTEAEDLASPTIGLAADGAAVVTYLRSDPTVSGPTPSFGDRRAWATIRPAAAAAFGAPQDVSANDLGTIFTGAAIDGHGDAIALFQAGSQPWAAVAPPGGTFGDAVRLSPAAHDMYAPQTEVAGDGSTHILWMGNGEDGYHTRHVVRPPGGPFGEMQTLPGGPAVGNFSALATDAHGNAAAAWRRTEGDDNRVQVSGYDAAPPLLEGLTVPSGAPGAQLAFGVTPVDVWSAVSSTTWELGDGATADGAQVTHAYAAPGSYAARVTATDALGNAASATGTATVTQPVAAPAGPLALTGLSLSPRRFRAALRGPSLAAKTGTTVRFTLGRAATVRFTVQRPRPGRRAGGRCVKPTARNRGRARCKRYVKVKGAANRAGIAGANTVRFSGRLRGRRLRPGRYRLVLRATDAAGIRSPASRARFRIVAR